MIQLQINKHVYSSMLLHYSSNLTEIAEQFNDYLTVQNVKDDYWHVDNMIEFAKEAMNKKIPLIIHLEADVTENLKCDELRDLIPELDSWYHTGEEPSLLLSRYFQLFIIRKIDYFCIRMSKIKHITESPEDNIHSTRFLLENNSLRRSIAALMGIIFNGCTATEQRRLLAMIQLQLDCETDIDEELMRTLSLFVHSRNFKQ